jgi:uncharacterized protein YbjT (DUF2867 family)
MPTVISNSTRPRLVFGASGYIGSNLVPRLLIAGIPVRACSRHPEVLEARNWQGAEIVAADALKPNTLATALEGIGIAYYLVHSMASGRNFAQFDLEAATNFARAAAEAGIERICYLGGLAPENATSEHIVSRLDTGNALRQGSVPVTEIRAGIIIGAGSAAFEVMRDLVYHLPIMITPRWVQARSTPIGLDNLLEYLIRAPTLPDTAGGIYDVGGMETLTYGEMMIILAEVAGKRPPFIIPVPILTPKLSSYWLNLVTSVPTNIARALIEGLKYDFVADSAPIEKLIPQLLLNVRSAVETAFAAERDAKIQARWTEGAFNMRKGHIEYAYYAKRISGSAIANAQPASVWKIVSSIGGKQGYYTYPFLWRLREIIDWMLGGSGLVRGRRHPTEIRLGDRIDSWEVVGVEPEHRLTLALGMRAPGAGVMEFVIDTINATQTNLQINAYWHPAGVWGLAYWYMVSPFHNLIFNSLPQEIAHKAEQLEAK